MNCVKLLGMRLSGSLALILQKVDAPAKSAAQSRRYSTSTVQASHPPVRVLEATTYLDPFSDTFGWIGA